MWSTRISSPISLISMNTLKHDLARTKYELNNVDDGAPVLFLGVAHNVAFVSCWQLMMMIQNF